jgi:hypothetical protein
MEPKNDGNASRKKSPPQVQAISLNEFAKVSCFPTFDFDTICSQTHEYQASPENWYPKEGSLGQTTDLAVRYILRIAIDGIRTVVAYC